MLFYSVVKTTKKLCRAEVIPEILTNWSKQKLDNKIKHIKQTLVSTLIL